LDALKTQLDKERSHSQNLKLQISTLNRTVNELKQTSLESLDMLESISVSHQKEMISLRDALALEKKRVSDLLQEQDELRTASQEAIDSYEATITSMEDSSKTYQNISDLERRRLQQDQTLEVNQLAHKLDAAKSEITQQKTHMDKLELAQGAVERRHQHEIKIFLQDINVLENVIQGKMDKENDLLNLLKAERKLTTRLKTELKVSRLQTKFNHYQDKPDTPIEDDEDDSVCAICNGKHDIIHCALTV
jgi:hypothetical protein